MAARVGLVRTVEERDALLASAADSAGPVVVVSDDRAYTLGRSNGGLWAVPIDSRDEGWVAAVYLPLPWLVAVKPEGEL